MAAQEEAVMSQVNRMQDDMEIAAGIWLIAAPWLLGYAEPFGPAAASSSVIGLVVILMSLDDYFFANESDEWVDAALGVALMLAPPVLGFTGNTAATINAIVCGFLITGVAAWALDRMRMSPPPTGWHVPHT